MGCTVGYSKEIWRKALQTLDASRARAQNEADARRADLYDAMPRLRNIDRELAMTGLDAAKAAISGGEQAPVLIKRLRAENETLQAERAQLLAQAGLPDDFLKIHYACPICRDTGYVGQKQCVCLTRLLRKMAYQSLSDACGIDGCRFETFRLDYYPAAPCGPYKIAARRAMEKIFSFCKAYADGFTTQSESLLFCGGTGLGKTHLSLSIAFEVIEKGFGVVYTTSQSLLDKLQTQQFSRVSADALDYQALALECDLLVIDDLGAEFSTAFTVAALYNLINARIIERRPTIISTNFDETVLRERYGDRILSRLLCTYRPLQFCGEDIRMLKRYAQQ
nr:ATP-binding protein [Anaerotruncus colihominis]